MRVLPRIMRMLPRVRLIACTLIHRCIKVQVARKREDWMDETPRPYSRGFF